MSSRVKICPGANRGIMQFSKFALALCVAVVPTIAHAGTVYYLNTGIQGANPSIDVVDRTDWYSHNLGAPTVAGITFVSAEAADFDPAFNWSFGGGNFVMKEGSGTLGSITLSLWDGGLAGTLVDSITWTTGDFCDFKASVGDGCQTYDDNNPVPLYFTADGTKSGALTPFTMVETHHYIAELTSDASTIGSAQYFIKAPTSFAVQNSTGDNLAPPSDIPEPGTWMLTAGAGALLLFAGTRRARA
jgi:hypothetical protein